MAWQRSMLLWLNKNMTKVVQQVETMRLIMPSSLYARRPLRRDVTSPHKKPATGLELKQQRTPRRRHMNKKNASPNKVGYSSKIRPLVKKIGAGTDERRAGRCPQNTRHYRATPNIAGPLVVFDCTHPCFLCPCFPPLYVRPLHLNRS